MLVENNVNVASEPRTLFEPVMKGISWVISTFNLLWHDIVELCGIMVKEGNYTLSDLLNQEFFFIKFLYDSLTEKIKAQKKSQEEENKRHEIEMKQQQQQMMQNYKDIQNKYS